MALNDRPIFYRGAIAVALLAALAVSGCGRKGALEPPPSAAAATAAGANGDQSSADPSTGDAAATDQKPSKHPEKPNRHFILDPLI